MVDTFAEKKEEVIDLSNLVMLVVGDDPMFLKVYERNAREFGIQAYFAHNFEEAKKVLNELKKKGVGINTIQSDINLPGLDGDVILNKLKAQSPHFVEIIVSSVSKEKIQEIVSAPFLYLNKDYGGVRQEALESVRIQVSERIRDNKVIFS